MDMKKILEAFDSASKGDRKTVVGVDDMRRFVQIVNETALKDREDYDAKSKALQDLQMDPESSKDPELAKAIVQRKADLEKEAKAKGIKEESIASFEEGSIGGDANAYLLAADKINDEVMAQIEKVKINADQGLLKELMDKFNAFMTAYHAVGKEILQPDLFKDSMGEAKDIGASKEKETEFHTELDKLVHKTFGDSPSEKKEKSKLKKEGLSFKDYAALAEAKKKMSASDDPCWKGYKMVGTKKKGGKEVPNCVPGKKGD